MRLKYKIDFLKKFHFSLFFFIKYSFSNEFICINIIIEVIILPKIEKEIKIKNK